MYNGCFRYAICAATVATITDTLIGFHNRNRGNYCAME